MPLEGSGGSGGLDSQRASQSGAQTGSPLSAAEPASKQRVASLARTSYLTRVLGPPGLGRERQPQNPSPHDDRDRQAASIDVTRTRMEVLTERCLNREGGSGTPKAKAVSMKLGVLVAKERGWGSSDDQSQERAATQSEPQRQPLDNWRTGPSWLR